MKDIRISLVAFYIIAPLLTVARVIQQFFLIEPETGFYVSETAFIANVISWSFAGMLILTVLLAIFNPKTVLAAPKKSKLLGGAAFALAAAMFYESAVALMSISGNALNIAITLLALLSAICFVWYGTSLVTDIKFQQFMMLFPVFWAIVSLIAKFIRYTGQSSIIDYTISTVTMCLVVYTLLAHSKIVIGTLSCKQTVIITGVGLSAVFFIIIDSLPTFIATVIGKQNLIHDKSVASLTLLVLGIYLMIFIHSLCKYEPVEVAEGDEIDGTEPLDKSETENE